MSFKLLDEIVRAQKTGQGRGITSICSAHPDVLQAALRRAARTQGMVLIEATCNQVNQDGGYSGLTPGQFAAQVRRIAAQINLSSAHVLLGGDHLGPYPWKGEPAEKALGKAAEMVQAYVRAGFTKIHLDTSMRLGDDDPACTLEMELAARRTAALAKAAELACADPDRAPLPCYVIGTEVPLPGGTQTAEGALQVTAVEDVRRTIEVTHVAFLREGLEAAWQRVVAVVVQPGVEFGDSYVRNYDPGAAQGLVRFIAGQPRLVYEAHSTDYQRRVSLQQLVGDHFAILKVGPALTFALREAVFALAAMEDELLPPDERSNLIEIIDQVMQEDPRHWRSHYHGTPEEQAFSRKYSRSDRIRYYWPQARVQAALKKLLANLSRNPLPLTLVSQFAPNQCRRIREGMLENSPPAIVWDAIAEVLDDYAFACGG